MARYNIVKNIRKRKIIILVVLLILIMVSWLIWGNLSVETNKLTVTSKDLPEAFDNFSIAHISDLHNAEYGKNNEKLIDILKQVGLYDKIKNFENGIYEKVKDSSFSKGEKQLLAFARAIAKETSIYIFDEPTSNIDVESENEIMERIYELAKTKTVILISHRLANVTGADNIYVLESGNVAECGTHEELLDRHGVYEKLWNAQQELESFGKETA